MIDDIDDIEIYEIDEKEKKPDPNIEWKKKGFDNKEVVGRKIDIKKANEFEDKKKTTFKNDGKKTAPKEMTTGDKKKVSTKIKDIYDDEDEEEFQQIAEISDDMLDIMVYEQKNLKQDKDLKTVKLQQNAEKIAAVGLAGKSVKEAGLNKLDKKDADKYMNDATFSKAEIDKVIKKDLSKKLNIKTSGKILPEQRKDLVKGVKRIKENGGNVSNMKVKDVAEAAKANDKRVAEIIYTNAPKKEKEKIHKQVEVSKILEKTGRADVKDKTKEKELKRESIKEIERGNVRMTQKVEKDKGR